MIVIGKVIVYGKYFNDIVDESKVYKMFIFISWGDWKLILDMVNEILI